LMISVSCDSCACLLGTVLKPLKKRNIYPSLLQAGKLRLCDLQLASGYREGTFNAEIPPPPSTAKHR
jgi:hypothetical protein